MDNIEDIYNILEGLTVNDVYQAYTNTMDTYNLISIGTALGVAVSLFIFFKLSSETALSAMGWEKGKFIKAPQWSKLLTIFSPTFYIIGIVMAYPLVLNGIESFLSVLQEGLGNQAIPESNFRTHWLREAKMQQRLLAETSNWDIGEKISIITNYYIILLFKPFIILLEQDAYSLYLALRYLYLMILELFGGVALALYLDQETRHHTFTWIKHMMFNYAMLGVFGVVNFFSDQILEIYINNNSGYSYNILLVGFGVVTKLFLFKKSYQILTSNIF